MRVRIWGNSGINVYVLFWMYNWKWMNLSKITGRLEYKQNTMARIKRAHDFFPFRAKKIVRSSDWLELIGI